MKLLLYCTKAKPYLYKTQLHHKYLCFDHKQDNELNGKIVAECDFEVEEIRYVEYADEWGYETNTLNEDDLIDKSCLSGLQLNNYLRHCKNGAYAIHIKNLHIFNEPRELSNYLTRAKEMNMLYGSSWVCESIDKAPQNMMYAQDENQNEQYILISIQPQWLCKILNGEKTIEVRKKVLKEVLE